MDPETGLRYRQPPRPPVRPFPNPTPQRDGLVRRLPTWSSRRAIPHTVPDQGADMPQIYTERVADVSVAQAPGGTFGKIVASEEEPAEDPYPFHYDIPAPIPYTNCPKQYISGNITRKLPSTRGPLKVPATVPRAVSNSSIPSSVPRSNPVSVPAQTRPAPPPPPQRSSVSPGAQQVTRHAPPPPPGPPPTSRPAPPPPLRPLPSSNAGPVGNTGPNIRRTRRPPQAPGTRPPSRQPGQGVAPPSGPPNFRVPSASPPISSSAALSADHPLFNSQSSASNPDIERANWFRSKLVADLEYATVNNQDMCATMHHTLTQLDGMLEELSLSRSDEEYNAVVSALEGLYESIQTW